MLYGDRSDRTHLLAGMRETPLAGVRNLHLIIRACMAGELNYIYKGRLIILLGLDAFLCPLGYRCMLGRGTQSKPHRHSHALPYYCALYEHTVPVHDHLTGDDIDLNWTENSDGNQCISLSEDKWELVQGVDMAMFYDDGDGYIDLGLDNIYDFDDEGNLLPNLEKTWLALNDQIVSYRHTETIEYGNDKYSITGYVPALLNGERVKLILTFDDQNEQGYVSGVSYDYDEETSEVEGKLEKGLNAGDKLEFLCDYYSYSGDFQDNYTLGKPITVSDPKNITIRNLSVGQGKVKIAYRFTDIYGQEYWSPALSL